MTIYEIKERTKETAPYFFTRNNMKFAGQTLKMFKVTKRKDGRFDLTAPRFHNEKQIGITYRIFNPENNKLEHI